MRDQLKDPDRLAHMLEAIDNVECFMKGKSIDELRDKNSVLCSSEECGDHWGGVL